MVKKADVYKLLPEACMHGGSVAQCMPSWLAYNLPDFWEPCPSVLWHVDRTSHGVLQMAVGVLHQPYCCVHAAGVYAISGVKSLGAEQRTALRELMFALGSIQHKKWTAAALDQAEGELLQAICLVEAYLPVTELDMKTHAPLHLPEKIRRTGPLFVTACWVYEGMWQTVLRLMTNQRFPELTALRSAADYEAAFFAFWSAPHKFAIKPLKRLQEAFEQQTAAKFQIPRELASRTTPAVAEAAGAGRFERCMASGDGVRETALAFHFFYLQDDR
jgi:hypothetical protein